MGGGFSFAPVLTGFFYSVAMRLRSGLLLMTLTVFNQAHALAGSAANVAFVQRQIAAGAYAQRTLTVRDVCSGRQDTRTFWQDGRGTVRRFRQVTRYGAVDQRSELNFWFDWAGRRDRVTQSVWKAGRRVRLLQLDYDDSGAVAEASATPPLSRSAILQALPADHLQYIWASREAALGCE
ncbi:hypothetical protein Deipr_1514 [Deinococcus proteolyticus MRP]|uniref:Uncharacterized protein n=3 Tax=Deinococcus TaxID=1298 RepID=F0RK06_DEIPM|nr:hypothetical protein Deipr_1514 [Deinococcus proteolyticus MRP]